MIIEYICTYISSLIYYTTFILIYRILQDKKIYFKLRSTIFLIILSILLTISSIANLALLNFLFNILSLMIIIFDLYDEDMKKTIYYSIVIFLILLSSDAIVSVFLMEDILIDHSLFLEKVFFRVFLIIPVLIISCVLVSIPFIKKNINNFFQKYISKIKINKKFITISTVMISIIVILFCMYAYNNVNRLGHILIIVSVIMIIIIMFVFLYMLYNNYQIDQVNKRIIQENQYIRKLSQKDEEFKHNIINNLLTIKTVGNKKTNLLIDQLVLDYQTEYKTITNINDLPNGIQSLIYRKAYQTNIENLNLIVENQISSDIYDLTTPKVYNDLCTAIGILFDNALDAVNDSKEKIINIEFVEDSSFYYISMKNSFSNLIDLEEIGKSKYTTKKQGHGIGLNYVMKIKGLDFKTEIIHDMFICKIKAKKIKKNIVK